MKSNSPSLPDHSWSSLEQVSPLCLLSCVRATWGFVSCPILCASSLPWCTRDYWINKCSKFISYEHPVESTQGRFLAGNWHRAMCCVGVWVCLIFTAKLGLFADAFLSFLQYSCNIKNSQDEKLARYVLAGGYVTLLKEHNAWNMPMVAKGEN